MKSPADRRPRLCRSRAGMFAVREFIMRGVCLVVMTRGVLFRMIVGSPPKLRLPCAKADAEHAHAARKVKPQQERHGAAQCAVEHIEVGEVRRINQEQPFAKPDQHRRGQRSEPDFGKPVAPAARWSSERPELDPDLNCSPAVAWPVVASRRVEKLSPRIVGRTEHLLPERPVGEPGRKYGVAGVIRPCRDVRRMQSTCQ